MILEFSLVLEGFSKISALDERDRVIDILQSNGYNLLMTDDGSRILMRNAEAKKEENRAAGEL